MTPLLMGKKRPDCQPPKAGKTTLLKSIARSVESKYPEIYLFILLIDERPEEVTVSKQPVVRRSSASADRTRYYNLTAQ